MRTSIPSTRLFLSLSLCASLALLGCGDDDDDAPATDLGVRDSGRDLGRSDGGTDVDAATDEDASTPADAGDASTPADAGDSDASAPADGGAAPGTRSATLSDFSPYGNCFIGIGGGGGDRLLATWTVRFENTGSAPYTVDITDADVSIVIGTAAATSHAVTVTFESLSGDPLTELVVPVGGASFQLRKATIEPASAACSAEFCADAKVTLSITLSLGGESVMLSSEEVTASCVY